MSEQRPDRVRELLAEAERLEHAYPSGPAPATPPGAGLAADGPAPSAVIVTARATSPSGPVTAITPGDLPNVLVVPMTIARRLTIRTVKVYLQSLVGFLAVGGFTGAVAPTASPVPLTTFQEVLVASLSAAVVPAAMSLLTNLLILFTRLDERTPELMA